MTLLNERTPLDIAREAFRLELLDAGLLIATSSPGIYGRSGVFESLISGLDRVLTEMAAPLHATAMRFPPVYPRADFERTDYIASFPDLSGVVSSFEAGDREHRELLGARERGERWDGWLTPADVVLTNAICHPLYATLEGVLPERRRRVRPVRLRLPPRAVARPDAHAVVPHARVRLRRHPRRRAGVPRHLARPRDRPPWHPSACR